MSVSVSTANHEWEIAEPAGAAGRALFRSCAQVIAECGWIPPEATIGDVEVTARNLDRFIYALAGHGNGERVLLLTMNGATIDGVKYGDPNGPSFAQWLDALPLSEQLEPWRALFGIWVRLGFFGDQLRKSTARAAAELQTRSRQRKPRPKGFGAPERTR